MIPRDELEDGEIEIDDDFGNHSTGTVASNMAPSFVKGSDQIFSSVPAISPSGTLSVTPAANANGVAVVTVMLHDNGGTANGGVDTSAPQRFTISVTPVNDAPVANDDAYTTNEDTNLVVVAVGVLGNDVDIDNLSLTSLLVSGPTHGAVTLNSDGSFTYIPSANFNGADSFTYKANDGLLDSNAATVSIAVSAVNDAPTAIDDSYTTNEDTNLVVVAAGVLGNDVDVDSVSLTSLLVSGPTHGAVTLNSDGSFTYIPSANFNGADSFTYKANDGLLDSNAATVSITGSAVNDAPTAIDDSYTTNEDTNLDLAFSNMHSPGEEEDDDSPFDWSDLGNPVVPTEL